MNLIKKIRSLFVRFRIWFRCIKIIKFDHDDTYAIQKGWFFYKYYIGGNLFKWVSINDYNFIKSKHITIQSVSEVYFTKIENTYRSKQIYIESKK